MSYASITLAAGRFGGRCLRTVWAGATDFALVYRALSAPTSAFSFGLAVQMSAFSASPFVWLLDPTGAYQFCLRTDLAGNLIACRLGPQCPDRSGPDGGPGSACRDMALYRGRRRDRRFRRGAGLC
jgi:hypothetical protein